MTNRIVSIVVAVVLLAGGFSRLSGAEGEAVAVELKTFKFKVKEDLAALFGYDETEQRLFFYTTLFRSGIHEREKVKVSAFPGKDKFRSNPYDALNIDGH